MSTIRPHHRALSIQALSLVALGISFAPGCASTTVGEVSGGRYTAPDDIFSMPVPSLSLGLVVEDDFGTSPDGRRGGTVSFHDDFGHVRSVVYEEAPDAAREKPPADALGEYFRTEYLAALRERAPGVLVMHQSPLSIGGGTPAWFTVLEIPEGSPMMVVDTQHPEGRRLDSTRAFLLLFHGDFLLTMSVADDAVLRGLTQEAASSADQVEALKQTVLGFYQSMRFP